MSTFYSAERLLALVSCTSFDVQTAVRDVLKCPPVDAQGHVVSWPPAAQLTVGQVLQQRVQVITGGRKVSVRGLQHACVLLGLSLESVLRFQEQMPVDLFADEEQLQVVFAVGEQLLQPHRDVPLLSLLKNKPDAQGFLVAPVGSTVAECEAWLQRYEPENAPRKLLNGVELQGLKLHTWRVEHANLGDSPRERVYDVYSALADSKGVVQGHCTVRVVFMDEDAYVGDLVYVLDAYDELGLEIGVGLQRRLQDDPEASLDFFDGDGFAYLHTWELRDVHRGKGLGMAMLKATLPVLTKYLRNRYVSKLVTAVCPSQFILPLEGLTPDILLEGLDAVESVQRYLDEQRPQDSATAMGGTDIVYVAMEPLASGSHLDQLALLAQTA